MKSLGGEGIEQSPSIRQVALASFIGTAIEWYDFYIFLHIRNGGRTGLPEAFLSAVQSAGRNAGKSMIRGPQNAISLVSGKWKGSLPNWERVPAKPATDPA
jgi:hypothetical protein